MGFLIGLLIFIADIWAILRCWDSTLSLTAKFLWTLVMIFMPVFGLLMFILFGRARPASAYRR